MPEAQQADSKTSKAAKESKEPKESKELKEPGRIQRLLEKVPAKKLIVLLLGGLVVLGGLGWGGLKGVRWWKARKAAKAAQAHLQPQAEAPSEEVSEEEDPKHAVPPAVMVLKPFPINLQGRRNAYLKVELHILIKDPELAKNATSDKPTPENSEIRAMVNEILSGKSAEEVLDPDFKEFVRLEIKDKLNERFVPKPDKDKHEGDQKKSTKSIKDVLIVEWAYQI